MDAIKNFLGDMGVSKLFAESNWWQYLVMYLIVGVLFYLAIVKKFEPLLLMPIAFGMLLANLPGAELIHLEYFFDDYYVETYPTVWSLRQGCNLNIPITIEKKPSLCYDESAKL